MIKAAERLAMRGRPEGNPLMKQNWEDMLFLHWPFDPSAVQPLIPSELELDTFEGQAWIGITPFRLTALRLLSLPAIPGLDAFLELNVRTYVLHDGEPGIWFFSLDASKVIPALAARTLFTLPYFKADMDFSESRGDFSFQSKRLLSPMAEFRAEWRVGQRLRDPHVESLAFFLAERYAFFAVNDARTEITRVYHHPWILEEAEVTFLESSMIRPLGLPEPQSPPLAHFSKFMDVEIWPPQSHAP